MYIEIQNLTKEIKGSIVLNDINLRLEQGKIYGIRGKNGSGKTMLMRAISGLILPTQGTIDINGELLGKQISFPRSIGILIENPSFLPDYTGFRNLKTLAEIQGKIDDDKIRDAIRKVGLNPDDKKKYKKYSLGMKQRLGIACAIMEEPDIVLLDEPINALDEKGVELVRGILQELKDRGAIVLVACHDREELEYLSDIIFEMESGRIVDTVTVEGDKQPKETRYKELNEIQFNVRKMRHDMKQHLTVISGYLQDEKIDDCQGYLREVLDEAETIRTPYRSGNAVLDYLVSTKLDSLKDTRVLVTGNAGDFSDIKDTDLSRLVGNILDNAIEGTADAPEKRIELYFHRENDNRVILCRNTVAQSVLKNNPNLQSTKPDKEEHGMGSKIIAKIVEDYNGILQYFEEDGMFGIQVILPIPL